MKTISLRYTDKFAPNNGTISEHRKLLAKKGYVWYGKMGAPVSDKVSAMMMCNSNPRLLLIHSGSTERYWLYVDSISREIPPKEEYPAYYHNMAKHCKTWFRICAIEQAERNVMGQCKVISSGAPLSEVSRHSMSPYFIIEFDEGGVIRSNDRKRQIGNTSRISKGI